MNKEIARQPYPDILWQDLSDATDKLNACWRKAKIILAVEDPKTFRYTEEDLNVFREAVDFLIDLVSKKFDPYLEEVELSEQLANDRKWKLFLRRKYLHAIHMLSNFDLMSLPLLERALDELLAYSRSTLRKESNE